MIQRASFLQHLARLSGTRQSSESSWDVYAEKSVRIQSAGLNVLWEGEGVSFTKTHSIR